MGIFKNITKSLKKAAPLIGSAIGMYFGGPLGASIGSGIGSLAAGRSAEEALTNAALAGGTAYLATGPGTPGAGMKNFDTSGSPLRTMFQGADTSVVNEAIKSTGGESFISKLIPESTMGKLALAGGIGALAGGLGEEQQTGGFKTPEYAVGRTRLGTGRIGNKLYNLDDPDERRKYFEDNRKRQGAEDIESEEERERFSEGGYANSKFSDLYRLANNVDFSEEEQRNIQSALDKRIGGRTGFDALPTGRLKFNTSSAGKQGYTEADIREMSGILAKRSAPKAPMMNPYMGDPSQLMRTFMAGGEVEGPGTGTSDSVPARLSDGEFVVTAKAVRGAGGGDRDVGAARMYDMMSQLERVA